MKNIFKFSSFGLLLIMIITALFSCSTSDEDVRVLVFSKTAGFRHSSIEAGIAAIQKLGQKHNFVVDTTENAERFVEENLKRYHAVIFLNTTGDVLNKAQQNDFERFIQAGGGYVGIHAATDTEYDWPWYGKLAGAYFESHPNNPNVLQGNFHIVDKNHPSTDSLPELWTRTDEFYNFKNMNKEVNVLIKIDEKSYQGGTNGDDHPMAWYHEYDGGRAFYTSMGHTVESFSEPLFLKHLLGGIRYAVGGKKPVKLDYRKARTLRVPEENRFTKVVLASNLEEPMELAVMENGKVIFVERKGKIKMYDPATKSLKEIAHIPVSTKYKAKNGKGKEAEDGLLGVALDPNFKKNNWIYLYYSPAGDEEVNILVRYELKGEQLDEKSRKEIIKVPVQREECCHTGGSMAFDADGNLYLSTGDNTNPHATGYAPIDERPGRSSWDAQRSSGNTNDLRGKILRIRPQADGSYTIPEGNLFPEGTPKTRPEIYTMGHRNPFRISVDKKTGYLYWGEIGPDAGKDSLSWGTKGLDEFNQARKAGNFGWPFLIGDNKAYNYFDFANNKPREKFDPVNLLNRSPNNTGLEQLPPGEGAYFWYPYDVSDKFPLFGNGGRSAMAGPVYRKEYYKNSSKAFPDYYDGKWFIYEWMRGWVIAVTMDEEGNYVEMERFMPSYTFSNPIDLEFGPEGDLYMLEYGQAWFRGNEDARLVRIEYNGGNRTPLVKATVDKKAGGIPLKVQLSSEGTKDFDRDELKYEWTISLAEGKILKKIKEKNPHYTFETAGVYNVELKVTDPQGASASEQIQITAGNEPPQVSFEMPGGNRTFFFPSQTINYLVNVTDKEDGSVSSGSIAQDEVSLTIDYLKEGFDKVEIAQGHKDADELISHSRGKNIIDENTCKSCHGIDNKSVGPSYKQVAEKYRNNPAAIDLLVNKIIKGGNGVWGEISMPAHPQLKNEDVKEIVQYILSLDNSEVSVDRLPIKGAYTFEVPGNQRPTGVFIIRAAYKDKGAKGVPGAKGEDVMVLRSPIVSPAKANVLENVQKFSLEEPPLDLVVAISSGSYISFEKLDMTGVKQIDFMAGAAKEFGQTGGVIEVRIGSPTGKLIGRTPEIKPAENLLNTQPKFSAKIEEAEGIQDVYFVFKSEAKGAVSSLLAVFELEFLNKTTVK